jgi:hypothetical protein
VQNDGMLAQFTLPGFERLEFANHSGFTYENLA